MRMKNHEIAGCPRGPVFVRARQKEESSQPTCVERKQVDSDVLVASLGLFLCVV